MVAGFFDLCYRGDLEGVQAALQGGFHVNTKDRGVGETGLIWALHGGRLQLADAWKHTAVVRLLLEQEDVDVNISNDYGSTALHYAASHDETSELLASLLSRSDLTISVDQKGWGGRTPLWLAVKCNAVRCVQLLISDKLTDPNIKDDDGDSPLMLAVKRNYVACVELLLANPQVDLMTRDNYKRSGEEVAR